MLGDHGYLDWTAADAGRSYVFSAGDDTLSNDIDRIVSTDPKFGGNDNITTGAFNDIVIGGFGVDVIVAGDGNNLVLGDHGQITAAGENAPNFSTQPITLGLVETIESLIGGSDKITTGIGRDIILGYLDWTAADTGRVYADATTPLAGTLPGDDQNAMDIDRVWSTEPDHGGTDSIITGDGNDIIIGGEDGEIVTDVIIGVASDVARTVAADATGDGDTIDAGQGNNIVFGDNGRITAATGNAINFIGLPITLGLVETIESLIGGSDKITTGIGRDIIMGGIDADLIVANFGEYGFDENLVPAALGSDANNIVIGDSGYLDWTAADAGRVYADATTPLAGTLPGDDQNAMDIDRVWSTETTDGGTDTIKTGDGDDIIIGGEDGEIISDVRIDGIETLRPELASTGTEGDTILAGQGNNLVFGDNGRILAAGENLPNFSSQPITLGLVTTVSPTLGGFDTITTGRGKDILLGGLGDDDIIANLGENYSRNSTVGFPRDGDNIVLGDHGYIDWTAAERTYPVEAGFGLGDDANASDIDRVSTTNPNNGGNDRIQTGAGYDFIFGGTGDDEIRSGAGNDLVFGDHGRLNAVDHGSALGGVVARALPLIGGASYLGLDFHGLTGLQDPFTFSSIDTQNSEINDGDPDYSPDDETGADIIFGEDGEDIVIGGQGNDSIYGGNDSDDIIGGHNVAEGHDGNDRIDGGSDLAGGASGLDGLTGPPSLEADRDVIAGDNASILRQGDAVDPRMRALLGTIIYGEDAFDQVTAVHQNDPSGSGLDARDVALFDHSFTPLPNTFGNDYIAGGPDNDVILGQLGNDTIQGDAWMADHRFDADGWIVENDPQVDVSAGRGSDLLLVVTASVDYSNDGDDYIEGNGGNDLIFGNFGQDDIIGGSSDFYQLNDLSARPDGADIIFGDNGELIGRNDDGFGTGSASGASALSVNELHAGDSDMILGDNGNIYRLVGTNGGDSGEFLRFNYDDYDPVQGIVVRAARLLDYTPGGVDLDPAAVDDNGAADEIHGESGDDFIYGMVGPDILYGDGQDDDLIGGYGHDWISGGTGIDGILGDDGRIYTSRNIEGAAGEFSEPLYGIAKVDEVDKQIDTPGDHQVSIINLDGALKKTVNLTPFNVDPGLTGIQDPLYDAQFADDVIYGGLGGDFLHGGAGDDAISGAEALPEFYEAPNNPGNLLRYSEERAGEFAAYDEFNPLRKILVNEDGVFTSEDDPEAREFILNFDPNEGLNVGTFADGVTSVQSDGDDYLFGDLGNDWLVGGTGNDDLFGGRGDDLLNADDNHDSTAGTSDVRANNVPDTHPSYEDTAYGGAGRDILLGNTGGDRLIDWAGEFNSYLVPFAPFGAFTISRAIQPQLMEYLYDLSEADGADPTRDTDEGRDVDDPRNGEPNGEIGLVMQRDFDWQDQTGAPDDPQPGNIPGGPRDVLRGADFNNSNGKGGGKGNNGNGNNSNGFAADSGSWTIENGRLEIAPEFLGGDAASVFYVDNVLPSYFEIQATVNGGKPTAGFKSNAYLIFDYQSPTDFKFAGVDISTDKMVMGHRTVNGWIVDEQTPAKLKPDQDYNLLVALNGTVATLVVDNTDVFSHVYEPRVDAYGDNHGLNTGLVGLGAENSKARIDDVRVQILPPEITLEETETFEDGVANRFTLGDTGAWQILDGRYAGVPAPGATNGVALIDLSVGAAYLLRLQTTLSTGVTGGLVFDQYSANDFKFVAISSETDEILIGHSTERGGLKIDALASRVIEEGQDYELQVTLKGTTVSVVLDGQTLLGHSFNGLVVDGLSGLYTESGASSFVEVTVMTNDPAYPNTDDPVNAGYQTWLDQFYPNDTDANIVGMLADSEEDTVNNLGEFFLNLDPTVPDGAAAVVGGFVEYQSENYQTLSYRRNIGAVDSVSVEVLRSTDLAAGWRLAETVEIRVTAIDAETEWVTVRSLFPGSSREFLKLSVTDTTSGAIYLGGSFGFVRQTTTATADTVMGLPVWRPTVWDGPITTLSGNELSINAALTGQQYISGDDRYYLLVTSGTLKGHSFTITGNGTSSITIDPSSPQDVAAQGLQAGDTFKVIPFRTLGTLFAGGNGIPSSSDVFNPVSTVKLYDVLAGTGINIAPSKTYFHHDGSQLPAGWYDNDALADGLQDHVVLPHNGSLVIRHSQTEAPDVLIAGQVPTSVSGIEVGRFADNTAQDNPVVNPYPVAMTLGSSGLVTSGVLQATVDSVFNPVDTLKLFADPSGFNSAPSKTYFYYSGSLLPMGWYDNDDLAGGVQDDVEIPAGASMIIRKWAGAVETVMWLPELPYIP